MSASILQIHLTMSEASFRTLHAAIQYASYQLETDMEKVFDEELDGERAQLDHLINELREAQQTLRTKGANV